MLCLTSYLNCFLKYNIHARSLVMKYPKYITRTRYFCENSVKKNEELTVAGSMTSKYELFVDERSSIIFDIERERDRFYEINDEMEQEKEKNMELVDISPLRGETGVIELKELIFILKKENAKNTVVIELPKALSYANYLVITNGISKRHMQAICDYIRKVYKYKVNAMGFLPKIEGKQSNEWKAIDLGNIVLHVFSESARDYYDIEMLWSVDKQFDTLLNKKSVQCADILDDLSQCVIPYHSN